MEQLTKEQAIAFHDSGEWKTWNHEQIVRLQLFQKKLCVPFGRFHEAMEAVLGRSVWTHEFGLNYDGLVEEYLGTKQAPTMQEIIDLIPTDKRLILEL
jgi:hypothetical protein